MSKLFYIIILPLIGLLLTGHLFQIVSLNEKEFKLQDRQAAAQQLSESIKNLEIKASLAGSLDRLENLAYRFNFERAGRVRYIRILDGSVVSKWFNQQ